MMTSRSPIIDDFLAMHGAGLGAALTAGLGARAPGPLQPLRGAGLAGAGLLGWGPRARLAQAIVHRLQLLAGATGHVAALDAWW